MKSLLKEKDYALPKSQLLHLKLKNHPQLVTHTDYETQQAIHASPFCGLCNFSLFNEWRYKVKTECFMKMIH